MDFLIFIFLAFPFSAGAKNLDQCSSQELRRRDCRLDVGSYTLRLLSETIARHDGTWHTIDSMPLKGEAVAWDKASFEIFGRRPILQLWLWDKGSGEAPVQSLHWYVIEIGHDGSQVLAEAVVRRRRQKPVEAGREAAYIYDAWEKHGLKPLKDGRLEWWLNSDKKTFEPLKAGH